MGTRLKYSSTGVVYSPLLENFVFTMITKPVRSKCFPGHVVSDISFLFLAFEMKDYDQRDKQSPEFWMTLSSH